MVTADEAEAEPSPGAGDHRVHLTGGVVAVSGFAFLILRVFAVSGYDWDTAFAVSTTLRLEDGLTLLFGFVMAERAMVALLLVCVLPLLIGTYLWSPHGRRPTVAVSTLIGLILMVALTLSGGRWWLPVAAAAVLGVFALLRWLPAGHAARRWSAVLISRVGMVGVTIALLGAVLVPTPWVPRERIETTSGTVTGYVLSVDSGFVNVLTDDHEFVILRSDEVLSRS